jgi:integrase
VKLLSKGLDTFGSAKQLRSRAEALHGVLGRLRADRPGQFVELDTTRLDVFALDEATSQWMNTELTLRGDI